MLLPIRRAERIDQLLAPQGLCQRVDREIALSEVVFDRVARQRQQVDLPQAPARDHAPGAEPLGEQEGVAAQVLMNL